MDDYDDPDMDARLGDLMGFTNFGAQPDAKKRKTSQDTFAGTSSNAMPLGQRTQQPQTLTHNPAHQKMSEPVTPGAAATASPTDESVKKISPSGVDMDVLNKLTWKQLEAYRKGVKQENGDIAYFLPSFIEDPWAKLEKAANTPGGS